MKTLIIFILLLLLISTAEAQKYTIQQYLNIKSAYSPSFSPDGKSIAYLSNETGTYQVWIIALPDGTPHQLTNYEDHVRMLHWLADGSGIIFGKEKGGDENTQFFWMKSDGSGVRSLTDDPSVQHNFGNATADGKVIFYASNKRDRKFFDIYSMEIARGKEHLRYRQDGRNDVVAVNDSGSKFIVSRPGGELSLDNNLYLVDTQTGAETLLTPHKGAAEYGTPHFVADGIAFAQNEKREFYSLSQLRKKNASADNWSRSNLETVIIDDSKWDIDALAMSPYGDRIAYALNHDGYSELFLRKYETGGKPLITTIEKTAESISLPGKGLATEMQFSRDQSKLAIGFSSASRNYDIWVYDLIAKTLTQVTHSDTTGISQQTFVEPALVKYKTFDGREISAWLYEPSRMSAKERFPVIISAHGGPEFQERTDFSPIYQYYVSRGYAILAPNVRGSTGYGKAFSHLDDVRKREDSVKDVAYAVEWLKRSGIADSKRIAVMGISYGGYMTMAAITLYPDLWAAAIEEAGFADFESYLKNTSGYRRRSREVEYGRLDRDLSFLRSISPLHRADRIKCPLFVIQGKNDPRIPYTEAEQIVNALQKRGAIVQYKLYDDEGHSITKIKNILELHPLVADFLDRYVKK